MKTFIACVVLLTSVLSIRAETLTWVGGDRGTWSADGENWQTEGGVSTAWVAGSVASFTSDATVTVDGDPSVGGLIFNGETLTLTGGKLGFAADAKLQYVRDSSTIRFESDIEAAGSLVQMFSGSENEDSLFSLDEDVYLSLNEKRKVLPAGVLLANLSRLEVCAEIKRNSSSWISYPDADGNRISYPPDKDKASGIYKWEYDAASRSATCQIRIGMQFQWASFLTCAKVKLTEESDGVYAQAEYVKTASYEDVGTYPDTVDFDTFTPGQTTQGTLVGAEGSSKKYDLRIHRFVATIPGTTSSGVTTTEIAGGFVMPDSGGLIVSNGVFRTIGTATLNAGASFAAPIVLGEDVTLEFAATSAQRFSSGVSAEEGTKGAKVVFASGSDLILDGKNKIELPVEIYGTATLPEGTKQEGYNRFHGSPGVNVYDGGILNVSACYSNYGHSGAGIICHTGGRVVYKTVAAAGNYDKSLTLNGGELYLEADYTDNLGKDNPIHKFTLSNGARVWGEMMTWSWSRSACTLTVNGTLPSRMEAKKIRFGQSGQTASSSNSNMIQKLIVEDVTGDENPDFTVSSTFYMNDWVESWEEEEYCGMEKSGAGTMLLTAPDSKLKGSFKIKDGTVAFGAEAALDGMALYMQGGKVDFGSSRGCDFTVLKLDATSTLSAREGARVTFADSFAVEWAEDAQLLLAGDFSSATFRIGTTGDSLTSAQLAQIRCLREDGRTAPVSLTGSGYLVPPWQCNVILIR